MAFLCMIVRLVSSAALVLGTFVVVSAVEGSEKIGDVKWHAEFQAWMRVHGKEYHGTDDVVLDQKLQVFRENALLVERHNDAFERGWTSYRMSLEGPFSDWTDEEFHSTYLMEAQHCSATTHTSSGSLPVTKDEERQGVLPKEVDWRTKGVVTPIKSQGQCGSCWTFSTTGALEAHTCLAYGADCTHWTGLAEQQLVDCAGGFNNQGCNGGLPSQAFEYIHYNGGIESEDSYPYTSGSPTTTNSDPHDSTNKCQFDSSKVKAKVTGIFNITSGAEEDIVKAVAKVGPVSVAYQVAADFRLYSHGVYDSFNATLNGTVCQDGPEDVNHAVVVVGYGETTSDNSAAIPFYIIRNSWGNTWGMEGYFWMVRGKNMCGISDCASFPIVSAPSSVQTKKTNSYSYLKHTKEETVVTPKV
eukprot:scaffold429439_cov59-Attheya_sp.AAC.2